MTRERWERVKDILAVLEGMDGPARQAALDQACDDDAELREEVVSLLAQEDRIDVFDRAPAGEPAQIGPYRIRKLLGSGGMGAVYLAERCDDQYRKLVAIKLIQAFGGADLERRFRRERQILAGLEHPYIARLLDGGSLNDGRPYLVMEYVDGQQIDSYVDEHKFSVSGTLRLFLNVCSAVQFAHQNLIVHRDLKPGNILVTAGGEPRLLDFGIARLLADSGAESEQTRPFERLLTPSSASPEQVSGGAVTTATDVYSLGVLLYRLLTGVSPYAGARDLRTDPGRVIQQYDPPPASQAPGITPRLQRTLQGDLDCVLAKALEKDPARRYPTVEEFAADIRRHLAGRPVKARKPTWFYRAQKFVRRRRVPLSVAALLLLAISAGVSGTLLYARRARAAEARADRRLQALRRMSESLLFEFYDAIQDLPGSTNARALVARRALEYLDQMAAEDNKDPAVQRDLAAAYLRLGGVLVNERAPHLGSDEASFRTTSATYQKALAIRRMLFRANPSDPAARTDLAAALWTVANIEKMQGHYGAARSYLEERLKLLQDVAGIPQFQYMLATTYATYADLDRATGNREEALRLAKQGLTVRQRLLATDANKDRAERVVGLSHENVGYALAALGRYREAAGDHAAALDIFGRLAARSPTDTDLKRNAAVAEENLCEVLARGSDAGRGIPYCRQAAAVADAMYAADHANLQNAEDRAAAWATLGFALHSARHTSEALRWEQNAVNEYSMLMKEDAYSPDVADSYAEALVELAHIEQDLRAPGACENILRAREIAQELVKQAPMDATLQTRLKQTQEFRGCP
jgi:serine/threonine protein kinase